MPTTQTVTATKSASTRKSKRHSWKKNGAPYVEPVKAMLGDKHLNPEESVCRLREELLQQESKKKIFGQKELEDVDRSSGPRMPWTELIRRLQKCNPGIRVKDGMAGNVALYFRKRSDEMTEADEMVLLAPSAARAMNIPVPDDPFFVHHKYVGGFKKEPMPEYAHVTVDTSEVAHREVRGWRSVLLALIKQRIITYQAAIDEFGNPESDKRSSRWFEQVAEYRQ